MSISELIQARYAVPDIGIETRCAQGCTTAEHMTGLHCPYCKGIVKTWSQEELAKLPQPKAPPLKLPLSRIFKQTPSKQKGRNTMAITNEAGAQLDVDKNNEQAAAALPPVIEPVEESLYATTHPRRADLDPLLGAVPLVHRRSVMQRPTAFSRNFGNSIARPSLEEEAYQKYFKETMYSSEVFFSNYLMDLIGVVRSMSGNEAHEKEALEQAVLLLQGLRDAVQGQSNMHYRSTHPVVADPFFPAPPVPGLKIAMSGEVDNIVTDITLAEYMHRLVQNHSPVAMNPCLMSFEGGATIRVAITTNEEDEGYHIVIIPEPKELLADIVAGELKVY